MHASRSPVRPRDPAFRLELALFPQAPLRSARITLEPAHCRIFDESAAAVSRDSPRREVAPQGPRQQRKCGRAEHQPAECRIACLPQSPACGARERQRPEAGVIAACRSPRRAGANRPAPWRASSVAWRRFAAVSRRCGKSMGQDSSQTPDTNRARTSRSISRSAAKPPSTGAVLNAPPLIGAAARGCVAAALGAGRAIRPCMVGNLSPVAAGALTPHPPLTATGQRSWMENFADCAQSRRLG